MIWQLLWPSPGCRDHLQPLGAASGCGNTCCPGGLLHPDGETGIRLVAHVDELKKALLEGGGQFMTAFQYRFHPGLLQVREWLTAGEIGAAISVRAHWGEYLPGWHPWEDFRQSYAARKDLGGGVVNTLCHPLDYLRWMCGDVSSMWAFTASTIDLNLEVEDSAEIGLQFRSGTLGSVHLDYLQRPARHTLEIIGDRGTLQWDNEDGIARLYRASTGQWIEIAPPPDFERNRLFLAEMAHFIRVIKERSFLVVRWKMDWQP